MGEDSPNLTNIDDSGSEGGKSHNDKGGELHLEGLGVVCEVRGESRRVVEGESIEQEMEEVTRVVEWVGRKGGRKGGRKEGFLRRGME